MFWRQDQGHRPPVRKEPVLGDPNNYPPPPGAMAAGETDAQHPLDGVAAAMLGGGGRVRPQGEELEQVLPLAGVRTSVEKRAEQNDEARRGEATERSRGRAKRKPDEKKIARRTSLRARTHGEAGHSGRFERRDSPRISATIARTSSRLSSPSSYKILITTLAEWRARNDSERLGTTARRKADARRGLGGDGGSNRDNVVNS